MFDFTIHHKGSHSNARTGTLTTANGTLQTPAFIPVATKAAIRALSTTQLKEIGFESLLCNTYHLYLQPGSNVVQKMGGLHKFMHFQGPIFTDSGGFQVFSLNKSLATTHDDRVTFKSHIDQSPHEITPQKSFQIQHELGADIIFTFDECIHYDVDYETTKDAMERTHRWTLQFVEEFAQSDSTQAIFGIVQGGQFKDLREESAKFISSLNFPGYGIGGIFGDPKKASWDIVEHTLQFLPYDKPKHMLGIGSVDDLFNYVELGADTFDCILPTRLARQGYIFITPQSGGNTENKFRYRVTRKEFKEDDAPLDKNCDCQVCQSYTRSYIHHLYKAGEYLFYTLTTYHNLYFFARIMEKIRNAINTDSFQELKKEWLEK